MSQPLPSGPLPPFRPSSIPRSLPVFSALVGAATAAWTVMMLTGPGLVLLLEAGVGRGATWDELLVALVVSMSLPSALVISAVYLPVVVARRQASLSGEPVALFALAGMLAGPIAGLLLLVAAHYLFARAGVSLLQDLARQSSPQFGGLLGMLVTLMLGGATFGGGFAWATRYAERPFRG